MAEGMFPKLTKSIGDFLYEEEGNITRNKMLVVGSMLILMGLVLAQDAFAKHRSHSSHKSHSSHRSGSGSHSSHVSHVSHQSHVSSSSGSHSSHGNAHSSHSNATPKPTPKPTPVPTPTPIPVPKSIDIPVPQVPQGSDIQLPPVLPPQTSKG